MMAAHGSPPRDSGPARDEHAGAQRVSPQATSDAGPAEERLSGLARRRLFTQVCECHEALLHALLQMADARDHAPTNAGLMRLQRLLRAAELRVARAERIALELRSAPPADEWPSSP
jgi:hypothetical protein